MQNPFQKHWLEMAIGDERDVVTIARLIAERSEFQKIIRESIEFAQGPTQVPISKSRIIAEHIAHLIQAGIGGFTTMHSLKSRQTPVRFGRISRDH